MSETKRSAFVSGNAIICPAPSQLMRDGLATTQPGTMCAGGGRSKLSGWWSPTPGGECSIGQHDELQLDRQLSVRVSQSAACLPNMECRGIATYRSRIGTSNGSAGYRFRAAESGARVLNSMTW